jgi:hypothetical protein
MLTESQKLVLKQIAERRIIEGGRCYFETRAQFFQLMLAAMSVDQSLTEAEFLREARHELAKHLQK